MQLDELLSEAETPLLAVCHPECSIAKLGDSTGVAVSSKDLYCKTPVYRFNAESSHNTEYKVQWQASTPDRACCSNIDPRRQQKQTWVKMPCATSLSISCPSFCLSLGTSMLPNVLKAVRGPRTCSTKQVFCCTGLWKLPLHYGAQSF